MSGEHKELIEDAAMALEGLLVASTTDPSQKYIGSLKVHIRTSNHNVEKEFFAVYLHYIL